MRYLHFVLLAAAAAFLAIGVFMFIPWGPSSGSEPTSADAPPARPVEPPLPPDTSRLVLLAVDSDGIEVEMTPAQEKPGVLLLELCALDGTLLAQVERPHTGRPQRLGLKLTLDPENPENYYLRFRSDPAKAPQQASLFLTGEILETVVLGQVDLLAGTSPLVHVLVRDRGTMKPVPAANVAVSLATEGRLIAQAETQTDAGGAAAVPLALPDREIAGADLVVLVRSRTAADRVQHTVCVKKPVRTFLVTDKPRYQAGQRVCMRGLSLRRSNSAPVADAEAVYEVEDARGNRVFRHATRTDAYGVSSADLPLADELNAGTWHVRATVAGETEARTITVGRYVLPRFKVALKPERPFYLPGETVKAAVQADYFFGKAVAGAKVLVRWTTSGEGEGGPQEIRGTTDGKGRFAFEADLPSQLPYREFPLGPGYAKFTVTVMDGAGCTESALQSVPFTPYPIQVVVAPESYGLIAGVENKVYVMTAYPDGTPAACTVTWHNPPGGGPVAAQTDAAGCAELAFVPASADAAEMQVTARDARGFLGAAIRRLAPHEGRDSKSGVFAVRTDRSLYRAGDTVRVSVHSTLKTGSVNVDLLKDHQTRRTAALALRDGVASGEIALGPDMAGMVQVSAWALDDASEAVRSAARWLLVEPARQLHVATAAERETFLPGEEAVIRFRVTDQEHRGTPAALGVAVTDEAAGAHQGMRPGVEKAFFCVEKEAFAAEEGSGGKPEEIFSGREGDRKRQEAAARMLLASAKAPGDCYDLEVNTFIGNRKMDAFQEKLAARLREHGRKIVEALEQLSPYRPDVITAGRRFGWPRYEPAHLDDLVEVGLLAPEDALDPWGHPLRLKGAWSPSDRTYRHITLFSPGIDGKEGTADDVSVTFQMLTLTHACCVGFGGGGREIGGFEGLGSGRGFFGGGADDSPRVRENFPETLYFNPSLITDAEGNATLNLPLADSITTWQMTCLASSQAGALGSTAAALRTFQEFFVDVDVPPALTRTDEVSVPVSVHNYLAAAQEVRLAVQPEPWFDLRGDEVQHVTVGPSEVRTVLFPIAAKAAGRHKLTVLARGREQSDAVARPVEVFPDGRENTVCLSDRLKGRASRTVTIPGSAIAGSARLFVKIYPSAMSHVVEGLDSLLQMPYGCFEQTTSVTYPNVLVLDYMKRTGKDTPQIRARALAFIAAGCQRLVSFEVQGGGFSLYGKHPASTFLTAYGLMEFHDMSKVYGVDPRLISRTQGWLAQRLGLEEPADSRTASERLRDNAYTLWALASSGYQGKELERGVEYLEKHLDAMNDNYTLALAANALAAAAPQSEALPAVVSALKARQSVRGDGAYWKAEMPTPSYGDGLAGDIETTALALQALVRCKAAPPTVEKAAAWLVRQKPHGGTWYSTQATIQALRALLALDDAGRKDVDATVDVAVGGKPEASIRLDASNRDLMHVVDLTDHVRQGDNTVEVSLRGEGVPLYQVVGRYHAPWAERPAQGPQPLALAVAYDRTHVAPDGFVNVTATVTNNQIAAARTVMLELGLPPGFALAPDELDKAVERKAIEKYTVTDRQVLVYLSEINRGASAGISYRLVAKHPLKVQAPASVAYPYYSPTTRGEAAPVRLVVEE